MGTEWKVPNHIAIILDGNGRWAKAKGLPRNAGHVQGAKTVEVICEEMPVEKAREIGAIGVFGNKYGENVKVYSIEGYSKEICGGPHAKRTSELGSFKIKKEESSSAGVRRIKAIICEA